MTAAAELDRARSTDRAKVDGAPKLTRRRLSIKQGAGSVPQSPSLSSTPSRLAKDKADMGGNGKSPELHKVRRSLSQRARKNGSGQK